MIKVLLIDDSGLIRQLLMKILSSVLEIAVVGGIRDPYSVGKTIKQLNPGVLNLDGKMPYMDGITFSPG